jgi:hypothetical protein
MSDQRVIVVDKCAECPYNKTEMCFHPIIMDMDGGNPRNIDPQPRFPGFCPLEFGEDYAEGAFNPDKTF